MAAQIQSGKIVITVEYKNTRFDPDVIEFHDIAKQMAGSVGYTADLSVDGRLAQLLRLRVAQMNPCSYCLILHTQAAHDQGISAEKTAHLPSWHQSTMYSDAEGAAFAYCEALTEYDHVGLPALHDALAEHFDERAIADAPNARLAADTCIGCAPDGDGLGIAVIKFDANSRLLT